MQPKIYRAAEQVVNASGHPPQQGLQATSDNHRTISGLFMKGLQSDGVWPMSPQSSFGRSARGSALL